MNIRTIIYPFILTAFAFYGGLCAAQENTDEPDEETLQTLEEGEGPDSATKTLELPEDASEQGVESSAEGLATANEAREKGREFGQETAEEAREKGREFGQEASEDARERGRETGQAAAEEARNRGAEARDNAR